LGCKAYTTQGVICLDNVVTALVYNGTTDAMKESLATKVGRDERVRAGLVPIVFSRNRLKARLIDFCLQLKSEISSQREELRDIPKQDADEIV
jgi:hypothetical protein